jgi:hypothetical protein
MKVSLLPDAFLGYMVFYLVSNHEYAELPRSVYSTPSLKIPAHPVDANDD